MKTLVDQLSNYAAYHRSQRNIATHLVGILMIVVAVMLLYYLRLNVAIGLVMTVPFGLALWFDARAAASDTAAWLAVGIGGFVVGWVFQFVGHYFEGRKPAFVDDPVGLVAEVLFHLGAFAGLKQQIEQRAGAAHA